MYVDNYSKQLIFKIPKRCGVVWWSSGKIMDFCAGDPGSNPGWIIKIATLCSQAKHLTLICYFLRSEDERKRERGLAQQIRIKQIIYYVVTRLSSTLNNNTEFIINFTTLFALSTSSSIVVLELIRCDRRVYLSSLELQQQSPLNSSCLALNLSKVDASTTLLGS